MEHTCALVMAGGRGTRMAASGEPVPKPLVEVGGMPMLERNVRALVRVGIRDIVLSISRDAADIAAFVDATIAPIVRRAGRLEVIEEPRPLGNIGCAGLLAHRVDDLLVVYADNLSLIEVPALVRHHRASAPAMTLAVHDEPFRLPYGRVQVCDGRVVGYDEKPTVPVTVCSAVSMLGRPALAALPDDRPTGISELAATLIARGETVAAFHHASPWVDVNDRAGAARAEALLTAHSDAFAALL